jgi:hypothetical protein
VAGSVVIDCETQDAVVKQEDVAHVIVRTWAKKQKDNQEEDKDKKPAAKQTKRKQKNNPWKSRMFEIRHV